MSATATDLRAGAREPHGHHERTDEGWDQYVRTHCSYGTDADTCGRHDVTAHTEPNEEAA